MVTELPAGTLSEMEKQPTDTPNIIHALKLPDSWELIAAAEGVKVILFFYII